MRRDSQYPTKKDHMICKCLSLSITYAATIGGLITITGTSTNLIFAEQFNTYVNALVLKKRIVKKSGVTLSREVWGGSTLVQARQVNPFAA